MNFYNSAGGSTLPPSPIGNTGMPQTGIPYTPVGSYYQNYNYGYYNPWEIQRRQDEAIKQYIDSVISQINMFKQIITTAHEEIGLSVDAAELDKQLEPLIPKAQNSSEYYKYMQQRQQDEALQRAIMDPNNVGDTRILQVMKVYNDDEEKWQRRYEGKSLSEMYEELNEVAFEIREEDELRRRRNLSGQYSHNGYRNLISQSSSGDPTRGLFSPNVDDMEVTLPSSLAGSYAERRAKFLQQVMGRSK